MKNNNYTKPFLRWAGGKGWLIKYLEMILGDLKFNDYHELFLGGGAVFFALNPKGNVYLGDINEELIHTYKMICSEPNIIIDQLEKFENTKDFYYKIRSSNFKDPIMRAVRFIYLNKTS
ncbi:DNA adenine methylase, partial [Enterococcus faecalis]|nr:DNA adenine methylase [Enterococcus faecalis]